MNCIAAWLLSIRVRGRLKSDETAHSVVSYISHLLISISSAEILLKYCEVNHSGKYRNECCRRLSIHARQ